MSIDEVKSMLGLQDVRPTGEQLNIPKSLLQIPTYSTPVNALPDHFDPKEKWGNCIQPVRNQQKCGSCWAFSAAETLGQRFCISSNGTRNDVLSPQDLVSCSALNFGCNGGNLALAWAYLWWSGITTDACFPYVSGDGHVPSCPSKCPGKSGVDLKQDKHYASKIYPLWVDLPSHRITGMKQDLYEHGPIQAGFSVYEDFIQYKGGVYQHTSGDFLGGHAVVIEGWGKDSTSGLEYWLIKNSWSETWGEKGYFRMRLGTDECGIEAGAWAGIPKL